MKVIKTQINKTFNGKEYYIKEFNGKLANGNKAFVKVKLNQSGDPQAMQCRVYNKNGTVKSGKGIKRNPKLYLTEVIDFLNMIRKQTDSWDVFEKFTDSISHNM